MPEPIPAVNFSTVIGLMEILNDHRGRMDIFSIDQLTDYDFGQTLSVIKAGEMLDFLDTPKNDVLLTDLGRHFIQEDVNGRKLLLNEQLRKLGTFRFIIQILKEAKDHQLPHDVVIEELVMRLPTQDPDAMFQTIVGWGRYAELLTYSAETETLALVEPVTASADASANI